MKSFKFAAWIGNKLIDLSNDKDELIALYPKALVLPYRQPR